MIVEVEVEVEVEGKVVELMRIQRSNDVKK